ncbi:MAG: hypothetical protein ACFE9L_16110 [Candidatus Hodarchaeota archaeon]
MAEILGFDLRIVLQAFSFGILLIGIMYYKLWYKSGQYFLNLRKYLIYQLIVENFEVGDDFDLFEDLEEDREKGIFIMDITPMAKERNIFRQLFFVFYSSSLLSQLLSTIAIIFLCWVWIPALLIVRNLKYDEMVASGYDTPEAREDLFIAYVLGILGGMLYILTSIILADIPILMIISLLLGLISILLGLIGCLILIKRQAVWKNYYMKRFLIMMAGTMEDENPALFNRAKLLYDDISSYPSMLLTKEFALIGLIFGIVQSVLSWIPL